MRKKPDLVLQDILIEAVAAEGNAIGHTADGEVLFVPLAVPGDVVDIRVRKRRKNYMEGTVEAIKKPSEQRREPFCRHFGVCGGCKWQILPYEMQLQAKQEQVYAQLVRIGHLEVPEIQPIIPSDRQREYRNKLDYTASSKRWLLEGENGESLPPALLCGFGFHISNYFDKVLDLQECRLQREPTNEIRLFIKKYALGHAIPFYDLRANKGVLRNLIVRNTEGGGLMIILCFGEDFPEKEDMLSKIAERFPEITSFYYLINKKLNDSIADQTPILFKGEDAIWEHMEDLRFKIGPKSFFQTNTAQALKLYGVVRDFASLSGKETVYDLYTGTGTIALFLARDAAKVLGIEYVPEAIEDAKINASVNKIDNCEFFAGDMKDVLDSAFVQAHGKPDVIVLDPPRAGIHPDVARVLLKTEAPLIVYVSCNPASQARDLAVLSEKYAIAAVQPVDMFPQTQHVENVCKLVLK